MEFERKPQCKACRDGRALNLAFTMAFQPIVDVRDGSIFAYEALVRGLGNEPASAILGQISQEQMYAFDQACRVKAITLAAQLGLMQTSARLSINFLPQAVYSPVACLQLTLRTAKAVGVPMNRLIFEIVEREQVIDRAHLRTIAEEYQRQGLKVALDDFGAGFSGLNLLADLSPDILKLDMDLIRDIACRPKSLLIVEHILALAKSLGVTVLAEGVETVSEYELLAELGVSLMQGFLFARPGFECFPGVRLPGGVELCGPKAVTQEAVAGISATSRLELPILA